MAWEGSDRRSRLPSDWTVRRLRVLRRDGYRCQVRAPNGVLCGAPAKEVDHKVRGDDHSLDNLQAICSPHHTEKTQAEARAARHVRQRERERHPGAID